MWGAWPVERDDDSAEAGLECDWHEIFPRGRGPGRRGSGADRGRKGGAAASGEE